MRKKCIIFILFILMVSIPEMCQAVSNYGDAAAEVTDRLSQSDLMKNIRW